MLSKKNQITSFAEKQIEQYISSLNCVPDVLKVVVMNGFSLLLLDYNNFTVLIRYLYITVEGNTESYARKEGKRKRTFLAGNCEFPHGKMKSSAYFRTIKFIPTIFNYLFNIW